MYCFVDLLELYALHVVIYYEDFFIRLSSIRITRSLYVFVGVDVSWRVRDFSKPVVSIMHRHCDMLVTLKV